MGCDVFMKWFHGRVIPNNVVCAVEFCWSESGFYHACFPTFGVDSRSSDVDQVVSVVVFNHGERIVSSHAKQVFVKRTIKECPIALEWVD